MAEYIRESALQSEVVQPCTEADIKEYRTLVGMANRSNSVRLLPTGRKNCNPHCHLIYNRVSNEGKTITDQNDFRRNEQVTKLLKQKYGLTSSKGKYKTKTERLRGCEKTKYEIHHLVMSAASESI